MPRNLQGQRPDSSLFDILHIHIHDAKIHSVNINRQGYVNEIRTDQLFSGPFGWTLQVRKCQKGTDDFNLIATFQTLNFDN